MEMESVLSKEELLNISPIEVELCGETRLICGTRNGVLYEVVAGLDSLQLLHLSPVPGTYPSLAYGCMNEDGQPDLIAGTMEGDLFILRGSDGWFDGSWERLTDFPQIPSCAPAVFESGIIERGRYQVFYPIGEWNMGRSYRKFPI